MIKLTDWIAAIPPEDKTIAYVGEHESVTREFFLPDLSYREYAFYLDVAFDLSTVTTAAPPRTIQTTEQTTTEKVNADGTTVSATANVNKESYTDQNITVDCNAETDIAPLAKLVQEDGIRLVWKVLGQQTQLPGLLRATLRAVGPNGEIKKSAMMLFTVAQSVGASPAAPISLTEHEQMEQAMVQAFEQAAQEKIDEMIDDAKEWADNVHGVYVGSGDMPAAAVIQIDPEGEALLLDNAMSDTSENVPKTKVVKAYVDKTAKELLDMVYPIGSIYMSVNVADPSVLFGGTWKQLKDRFLLGAGDSYAAGATGGEATHTLTTAEMPTHAHSIKQYTTNSGGLSGATKAIASDSLVDADYTWRASAVADAGGGAAHNNMPPYLAVYMWQRVA